MTAVPTSKPIDPEVRSLAVGFRRCRRMLCWRQLIPHIIDRLAPFDSATRNAGSIKLDVQFHSGNSIRQYYCWFLCASTYIIVGNTGVTWRTAGPLVLRSRSVSIQVSATAPAPRERFSVHVGRELPRVARSRGAGDRRKEAGPGWKGRP